MTQRALRLLLVTIALSVAITGIAALAVGRLSDPPPASTLDRSGRAAGSPAAGVAEASDPSDPVIASRQAELRVDPDDRLAWAELGTAYVDKARTSGDPTWYPKAEGALARSLEIQPDDNFEAMLGSALLANAQHDFGAGLTWARQAEGVNRYSATVYGALNDSLTQLGDYPAASAATKRMLELAPGVASYTRASYDFEQRGADDDARYALDRALEVAKSPADVAFCRAALGDLSFNSGDPAEAVRQHDLALEASPRHQPSLAGRARAEAALGRPEDAIRDYEAVLSRVPLPEHVLELGELHEALGDDDAAQEQYDLLGVELELFAANGVFGDLTASQFEADHGDPERALELAGREWERRQSVLVADAMAWALHANDRDAEALVYATQANRLGWHNATFRYHLGMIEAALGRSDEARVHLGEALMINPGFSPLRTTTAKRTLAALDGRD